MFQPEDLEKFHFVPIKTIKKVIETIESPDLSSATSNLCRRNLANLQASRTSRKVPDKVMLAYGWKDVHQIAIHKAIYSQNWNRLLYLLKKCPPWEHTHNFCKAVAMYYRALTILLMYHPTAQAKSLFNHFLHMVWSCRTDEDKKAIQKIILSLPERIYGKIDKGRYKNEEGD